MSSSSESVRASLRAAADDLIEGRVPGPLTGIRLVEVAGVKRHRLTHDNPDINAEFQLRAREINRTKPEVDTLRQRLEAERVSNRSLRAERADLESQVRRYAAAILALTEERDQLLEALRDDAKVIPIRPARG